MLTGSSCYTAFQRTFPNMHGKDPKKSVSSLTMRKIRLTLFVIGIILSFQAFCLRKYMSGTTIGSERPAMYLRLFFDH